MKNNKSLGTALITGGAKRIGKEIAIFLAKSGYDIVISYKESKQEAQDLSKKIQKDFNKNCEIVKCDFCDISQTKKLANFMSKKFPNWNLLINNASIFHKSNFSQEDSENALFDNMNIHFFSPIILSKSLIKLNSSSTKKSQIINIVDKNITRFETSYFYYLLSKKCLAEFTKMLSLTNGSKTRVNAIAPGFILNPIDQKMSDSDIKKLIEKIPTKTKGDIENIIQGIEFLLKNSFVNGQILFVDGGANLNHAG